MTTTRIRVLSIFGTRPEAVNKMAPIILELERRPDLPFIWLMDRARAAGGGGAGAGGTADAGVIRAVVRRAKWGDVAVGSVTEGHGVPAASFQTKISPSVAVALTNVVPK
jgi:hypothetical protein